MQLRIEEILRIRLDGAEMWDVREYVRDKEQEKGSVWERPDDGKPLSDSQLWRYIAEADKLIAASCRASRKKLLRRHLAQRRNLYAKAVSQGDIRAALACVRDEAELLGLYEVTFAEQLEDLRREIERIRDDNSSPKTPIGPTAEAPRRAPEEHGRPPGEPAEVSG
jgi:hypothetical protein